MTRLPRPSLLLLTLIFPAALRAQFLVEDSLQGHVRSHVVWNFWGNLQPGKGLVVMGKRAAQRRTFDEKGRLLLQVNGTDSLLLQYYSDGRLRSSDRYDNGRPTISERVTYDSATRTQTILRRQYGTESREVKTFDALGNLLLFESTPLKNPEQASRRESRYQDNRLIAEASYYGGKLSEIRLLTYNNAGNVTDLRVLNGDSTLRSHTGFRYTPDGAQLLQEWAESDVHPYMRRRYIYTDTTKREEEFQSDGQLYESREQRRDAHGKSIFEESFRPGESRRQTVTWVRKYDGSGREVEILETVHDGNSVEKTRYHFERDRTGNITRSYRVVGTEVQGTLQQTSYY